MSPVIAASDYVNGFVPYVYNRETRDNLPVVFTDHFISSYKNSSRILKLFYVSFDIEKYEFLKSYYDNMVIDDGIVVEVSSTFNKSLYTNRHEDFLLNGNSPRVYTVPTEFIDKNEFALEVSFQFSEAGIQSLSRSSLYGEMPRDYNGNQNNHRVFIKNGDDIGFNNNMIMLFRVASTDEIGEDGTIDWDITNVKKGEDVIEIYRPFFVAFYSASSSSSETIPFTYGQVNDTSSQSVAFKMQPGIRNIIKLNYSDNNDYTGGSLGEGFAGLEHAATFILNDETPIPLLRHRHKTSHMRVNMCLYEEKCAMLDYVSTYMGDTECSCVYSPVDAMSQRNAYYKHFTQVTNGCGWEHRPNNGYTEFCESSSAGWSDGCVYPSYDGFISVSGGEQTLTPYLNVCNSNSKYVANPSEIYSYAQENNGSCIYKNGIISTIGLSLDSINVLESYCNNYDCECAVAVLLSFRGL